MLHYALMFFVIALVAALLGVQGVAGQSAEVGYVLVSVAVIFLLVAFLSGSAPLTPRDDRGQPAQTYQQTYPREGDPS